MGENETFVVVQPGATLYADASQAKDEALLMAQVRGGVWMVARVTGRAVPQAPVSPPPQWEDAPYGG